MVNTEIIQKIQDYFKLKPVVKVWLFGSVSRGEETHASDVDILVIFDRNAKIGLFEHAEMEQELQQILNRSVDMVTYGTLFPWVRENVEHDRILIYERENA